MADLLDLDGVGEGSLLGIVSLQLARFTVSSWSLSEEKEGDTETHLDTVLLVGDRIGSGRGMMATNRQPWGEPEPNEGNYTTYLTCSLIRVVSPASGSFSHLPRKSSPRKGFKGFFSLPSFSLREQYC